MEKGKILSAFWVPGLPHILSEPKSQRWCADWDSLRGAYENLASRIAEFKPQALILYSTQWVSVLGTSVQVFPHLKGIHVDDNWHDWGDLKYDLISDGDLGRNFEKALNKNGYPARSVDFECFPVDTGTIVANRFLNPKGEIPVSVVSSWVYADAEKSYGIGRCLSKVIDESGKRVVVVACSLLSARYFTTEIDSAKDRISHFEDDKANRRFLSGLETTAFADWEGMGKEFKKEVGTDMQFNAFFWMLGILCDSGATARVRAYGPQWGTGAAVFELIAENH